MTQELFSFKKKDTVGHRCLLDIVDWSVTSLTSSQKSLLDSSLFKPLNELLNVQKRVDKAILNVFHTFSVWFKFESIRWPMFKPISGFIEGPAEFEFWC